MTNFCKSGNPISCLWGTTEPPASFRLGRFSHCVMVRSVDLKRDKSLSRHFPCTCQPAFQTGNADERLGNALGFSYFYAATSSGYTSVQLLTRQLEKPDPLLLSHRETWKPIWLRKHYLSKPRVPALLLPITLSEPYKLLEQKLLHYINQFKCKKQ